MTEISSDNDKVPRVHRRDYTEGVELSDDDLEYVVGGLAPEATEAHVRYLRELFKRR